MRPLSATDMRDALREVAEHLQRSGVQGRLYVAGGAAMALAYDAERLTRDIDAAILHGHNAVMNAVRAVAGARGWPSTWLNEQATTYMPQVPDRHSQVVFDHSALQVAVASPAHMLAMKARAARAQDIADVANLLDRCGLSTAEQVDDIVQAVFGGEPLGLRQRRWIEDLITHSPAPDSESQRQQEGSQLHGSA